MTTRTVRSSIRLVVPVIALTVSLAATSQRAHAVPAGFVYASGNRLMIDGQQWRAVGVNVWDMDAIKVLNHDVSGCYFQHTDLDAYYDNLFASVKRTTHANVVRTFDFVPIYTGGGESWGSTDKLLYYAQRYNIKVIPVFAGQYEFCGEPVKSSTWYHCTGLGCTPGYKDPSIWPWSVSYRQYVVNLVSRYKDNPMIAFWQLMNEAQSQSDPQALVDFSRDMISAIRTDAGDTNHLINLGTVGAVSIVRPDYANLLDGSSASCPSSGTSGCNDLAEAHDYPSRPRLEGTSTNPPNPTVATTNRGPVPLPLAGEPLQSTATVTLQMWQDAAHTIPCSSWGSLTIVLDPQDLRDWTHLQSGIPSCSVPQYWSLKIQGPANRAWSGDVDGVTVWRGGNAPQAYSFETATDEFSSHDPSQMTVSQELAHAAVGAGALRFDMLGSNATGIGTIDAPPLPPPCSGATCSVPPAQAQTLSLYIRANFSAPITSSGVTSIATDLHDANDKGKPFFLGEVSLQAQSVPGGPSPSNTTPPLPPATLPFTPSPAYCLVGMDANNAYNKIFTLPERALYFQQEMAYQFDGDHQSSGWIVWDYKDPTLLSSNGDGTPRLDPMISMCSIEPADPATTVIASFADQYPNPSVAAPAPLGSYPPAIYVVTKPPASAARSSTFYIKLHFVHDGGDTYRGVTFNATGGCTGSGTTDALGYVGILCTAAATPGTYTITLAPNPATCSGADCAGLSKSYSITLT